MFRAVFSRRCAVGILCSILVLMFATPSLLPVQGQGYGRSKVRLPDATEDEDWYGTWFYVSRKRKMALWIRDNDGTIECKLRLLDRAGSIDSFTTDWSGHAKYAGAGKSGEFALTFDEQDANRMTGTWRWEVRSKQGLRTETADLTLYRSGWGRSMVWKIENLYQRYPGEAKPRDNVEEMVWVFRKASRRQALWDELPF